MEIARGSVMVPRVVWHRRGDLELVYHGLALCMRSTDPIHIGPVTLLTPSFVVRRHGVTRFAFIVDDENSRNASNLGGDSRQGPEGSTRSGDPACGGPATSVDTGMAATTPPWAGLFESYDREQRRVEEQIGSGMLLSTPEARDQWYELRNGWL